MEKTLSIYKEDYTESTWNEMCKELGIEETANEIELTVTKTRIVN